MIATLILLQAAPAAALPPGPQVVITDAGNGGLRDWRPVPGVPGDLYVRDRTERWYRVRLSGACERYRTYDAMNYTTDTTGTFDRFSTVRFIGAGPIGCSVLSITRAGTPPQIKRAR